MRGKGKVGVKRDPKDLNGFFEGKELVVEEDLRMEVGFPVV